MVNTSYVWQQATLTTHQLSSPSCSTRAIQNSLTLKEKERERERDWFIDEAMALHEGVHKAIKKMNRGAQSH